MTVCNVGTAILVFYCNSSVFYFFNVTRHFGLIHTQKQAFDTVLTNTGRKIFEFHIARYLALGAAMKIILILFYN